MNLENIKNKIGERINGVTLNIDIVNVCCLECPSCAIGSIGTKRKGIMTFDTFRRILDKAESEMKIRRVMMYVYSDPCMHKDLHLFIQEMTDRNLESWISTMLQATACDFEKVLAVGPSEFRISFPGWEKMSYFQSKKADPERFNRNVEVVGRIARHERTTATLFFQRYKDNGHEVPRAQELADRHGLKLVVIPAIFMPLEKYVDQNYSAADHELISHLFETPEEGAAAMRETKACQLWKQITLDANADIYLCQLVYQDRFKIGNYFNLSRGQIRKIMETHPFCSRCLSMKGNQLQNCYSPPAIAADPSFEANKKRRLK